MKNSLARKQLAMFYGQLAIAVLSLLTVVIVTRSIGVEGYGRVGLILAVVTLLSVFLQFGIGAAFNRQLSILEGKKEKTKLLSVVILIKLLILVPTILLFIYYAESFLNVAFGRGHLVSILVIALVSMLFSEILQIFDMFFIGVNHLAISILIGVFVSVFRLVFFIFWPQLNEFSYFVIMGLGAIFGIILFLIVFYYKNFKFILSVGFSDIRSTIASLWSIGLVSSGTKIIYSAWDRLPILLISGFANDELLGKVDLAVRLADRFRGIGASISKVNLSHLTSTIKEKGINELARVFKPNFTSLTMLFGAVLCLVYFFSDLIIYILAGNEYLGAGNYLAYSVTLAYLFLQMNWVGSGVLYASNNVQNLILFHALTKSLALLFMIFILNNHISVNVIFSTMIFAEFLSVCFYFRRSISIGVFPFLNYAYLTYLILFVIFFSTF